MAVLSELIRHDMPLWVGATAVYQRSAAIERHANAGLLRSVAVAESERGRGTGAALIERCLEDAGVKPRRAVYAGRPASASPATGLAKRHAAEQAALIADALGHSSQAPAQRKAG